MSGLAKHALSKKLVWLIGFGIFFLFTVLQLNDFQQYGNAHAWVWVAIYTVMAALNLALVWFKIDKHWLFAWAGFTWGAFLFRIQDAQGNIHLDWMDPRNYWESSSESLAMVQQANESGGLLVLAFWACLTCYIANPKER